jgi:4-hydroxy-tetrahydrodipicolinate synthase
VKLEGSYVALVTPFKDDAVDYDALERLVAFHIENGTQGLVPCGTTGESPSLSYEEHKEVVAFVIRQAAGKLPVIAGTGANSTREAIELTAAAAEAGADATLHVSPYYNKPEPDGMFAHFKAIADATHLPIVLYNIPSRTGREIALETVFRLADEVPEVVGIKEAGGSTDRVSEICRRTGLTVLSGDDCLTLPIISVGGQGVISVLANIIPRDMADMTEAALHGDFQKAREAHLRMFPLFKACFIETNPIPIKTAMGMLGMCSPDIRLPLSPMRQAARQALEQALNDYGLLS